MEDKNMNMIIEARSTHAYRGGGNMQRPGALSGSPGVGSKAKKEEEEFTTHMT